MYFLAGLLLGFPSAGQANGRAAGFPRLLEPFGRGRPAASLPLPLPPDTTVVTDSTGCVAAPGATGAGELAPGLARPGRDLAGQRLRFGRTRLVVRDIFTPVEVAQAHGLIRLVRRAMNSLHVNTRHYVLRRELLFHPGAPFEPSLLAETERNLRGLGYLNNVTVVPTDTLPDRTVDVRVGVQETWSLGTHFAYAKASDNAQRWNIQLSEKNFLGHGAELGLGLGETEDYRFTHLFLQKRRLLGSNLILRAGTTSRGDRGYSDIVSVWLPFYAQDDTWGWQATAWREETEERFYLSNAGPAGLDSSSLASLYSQIPVDGEGVRLNVQRRLSRRGAARIWRLGLGLETRSLDFNLDQPTFDLSDGRQVDLSFLASGQTPLSREQGTLIYPHLLVASEGRAWATARYLLEYGVVEDLSLVPTFQLRAGPVSPSLGSTSGKAGRLVLDLKVQDWSHLGSGFLLLKGDGLAVLGEPADRTSSFDLVAGWLGRHGSTGRPRLSRIFAEVAGGDRLLGTDAFVLGLNRGQRTLGFDGRAGDRLVRWNLEHGLVLPRELLGFYRGGLAVFYGGGIAWWAGQAVNAADIRHEAGVGIRFGATRAARGEVGRLDLTWDLKGGGGPVVTAVTRGLF